MKVTRFLLCFALGLLVGCARPASTPIPAQPVAVSSPSPLADPNEDGFAAILLKDKSHCQPALSWLENRRDHILWKGSRAAIEAHFRELTAAGTKEIWASTHDLKDKQVCAAFVVVLPSASADRHRAFELYNRFWASQISDPAALEAVQQSEHHQKYLLYSFD